MCGLTAHCIERHFNYLPSPSVCHQIIPEWSVDQIIKEPVSPEHDLAKLWWELFHANLLLSWTCKTVNNLCLLCESVENEFSILLKPIIWTSIIIWGGNIFTSILIDGTNFCNTDLAPGLLNQMLEKILKQSSQSGWHFNCISAPHTLLLIWRSIMWSVFNLLNIHSSSG